MVFNISFLIPSPSSFFKISSSVLLILTTKYLLLSLVRCSAFSSLEKIKILAGQGKIDEFLIPLELLLSEFPKIILSEDGSALAKNGNSIYPEKILKVFCPESVLSASSEEKEIIFRLFDLEGKLLALARKLPEKNCLHPFLVIDSNSSQK